ncbi:BC_2427 family protein [Parageobacillus thermoglucosidasius]|uniref:BC_2427 family protein n=1 Tax=Parageobacillus thermoglucosidasius TaxID=1426 RepID=UPI002E1C8528|nr:hypothetical protein [Parageobacillus thermoglucosidasius]MED4913131.1 hypothetical protein [Parageobacillus thermoglucosidasius]MED4945382.1 hypothetical protein [Parageobacillus thermoglucosidasius]MED4981113.1 hypothetical protein [Parageobacillus thermoglucosidasius]
MKTPWIHYERMQQIHSKQMNVFQSSRVQKKPIYPGFQCINKERTKKENDGCESNTAPSRADTVETVNLHENYDIKKMPKLHKKNNVSKRRNVYKTYHMAKRNQTGSTDLSPSSPDRDDPEQVFSADGHVLKTDGPSYLQHIPLTDLNHGANNPPSTDPVLKSGYPSSTDEKNESLASESGDETYLLDDTDSLSPLLDETGLEQVSATDDEHLLQADGSSPFQPVFLTNRGQPAKEPPADPVLKSGYPSSTDERNEPPASENGDETYLLDDTDSLSPLFNETGLEQVSATGDDHLLQADGSSPFQPVFLTNRGQPAKELTADPVLKSGYPSSTDERNEPPASENGDKTYLLDDTDSLSPLLDETGLEQVSATDDDHLLQADGSSPFQPIFLTNRGWPVKELIPVDPVLKSDYPSSMDERNEPPASENGDETYLLDDTDKLHKYEKICSMTIKSPFSTFVEIDDFLHPPIFGSTVQNSAEFLDLNNKQTPQSSTKLFNTTTYYPEQPYGHLVCSKIHEMLFFTDTVHTYGLNQKNNHYESIVVPVHGSPFAKIEETNNKSYASHDFIQIRAPVVVGEYKVEICLEDGVVFEEEITRVKEISKEVVLTTCKFVPTQFSPSLDNGICPALKGMLFIEGYIRQNIEYTAASNRNAEQKEPATHLRQLHQKMVLDLIIHLLQVQQVLLSYDGNGI